MPHNVPSAKDALRLAAAGFATAGLAAACGFFAPALDAGLVTALNPDRRSALDAVLRGIDAYGPTGLQAVGLLAFAASLLFSRAAPRRLASIALWAGFVLSQTAASVMKTIVRRERPLEREDLAPLLRAIEPLPDVARSFPSGHVTTAAAIAAGLWLWCGGGGLLTRVRGFLYLAPLVMAYNRVALGLHHPSDALAGAAAGFLAPAAVALLLGLLGNGPATATAAPAAVPASGARAFLRCFRLGRGGLLLCGAAAAVLLIGAATATPVVGRDPATGEIVPGFRVKRPSATTALFEPWTGPPLLWARLDGLRETAATSAAVIGTALLVACVVRRRRGPGAAGAVAFIVCVVPATWVAQFCSGARSPAKFQAEERGVFVDWHLHGGDRADGRLTEAKLAKRQSARGVSWAITTRHDDRPEISHPTARGVFGVEWSGGDYPRSQTPHVLVLGSAAAVDAARSAPDALEAVRRGKAAGGTVIVAHLWRTAASLPGTPDAAEFLAAGADGFEIGNRMFDRTPERRADVVALDRFCREAGLPRFSFSDDHGVPSGSGAVTFLRGVRAEDLEASGDASAPALLRALRRDAAPAAALKDRVVPLVFDDRAPLETGFAAAWPVRYVRALDPLGRVAWLLWIYGAAVAWRFYRRPASAAPADVTL
jgi:undecaprenyl-diphosphatase